jgi:hypothetical protein
VAAEKLITGDIDAVFIIATWGFPPVVQRLITARALSFGAFLALMRTSNFTPS